MSDILAKIEAYKRKRSPLQSARVRLRHWRRMRRQPPRREASCVKSNAGLPAVTTR